MILKHNHKIFMIVDDDKDDRFFFRKAVKQISPDHICIEAQHGADAIEQLMEINVLPDYIFLDLNMPIMNGQECLTELKANERLRNIPVIIYSTSAYVKDKQVTHALGACHYLVKSGNLAGLPAEIINAMQVAQSHVL